MYIAVYAIMGVLLSGLMSIFYIKPGRRRSYLNAVVSVMLFFILLFEILSGLFGIHQTGALGSSDMPQAWINRGWFGWLLLVLITLGVFSPIWLAGLSRNSRSSPSQG
jgi:hypothetical protein